MATRQYIGARYIPVFADPVEWDNTRTYEHLTMVQHLGETYMSKQAVPIGIDLPDVEHGSESNDYWVHMSNWNAQVESYREEVLRYIDDVEAYNNRISGLENELPSTSFDSVNTVEAAINGIDDKIGGTYTSESTVDDAIDAINDKIGGSYTSESTVDDAIDAINDKIGGSYTSENTVKDDINDVELRSCPNKVVFTPVQYVANSLVNSACAFAKTVNDKVIMFDAGVGSSYTLIKNSLDSNNVSHIDYIVISHYHGDHIENVVSMISDEYIDADTVFYLPANTTLFDYTDSTYVSMMNAITTLNCTKIYPTNGQTVEIDSAELEFYNCSASDMAWMEANAAEYNNCSMITYLKFGENTIAFFADIETVPAFDYIVEQGYVKSNTIMTAPHHGFTNTMSSRFLTANNSECIVCQGTVNGFNSSLGVNPFLNAKNRAGIPIYLTGLSEVNISLNDNGYIVDTESTRITSRNKIDIGFTLPEGMVAIHVNYTTGFDGNDGGSADSPFKTINRALAQASVYDAPAVIVFDSDYKTYENIDIVDFPHGLKLMRPAGTSYSIGCNILSIYNSYVNIELPVECKGGYPSAMNVSNNSSVYMTSSAKLTISGDWSSVTQESQRFIWVTNNSTFQVNNIIFSGSTNSNVVVQALLYIDYNSKANIYTLNTTSAIKSLCWLDQASFVNIFEAPDSSNYTYVLEPNYPYGAASGVQKRNPYA